MSWALLCCWTSWPTIVTESENWSSPHPGPVYGEGDLSLRCDAAWSIHRYVAWTQACRRVSGSRFVPQLLRAPLSGSHPGDLRPAPHRSTRPPSWPRKICCRIGNALGIPFLIFRLQNVYGEGQSLNNPYTGILSIFSNRIRQGKESLLFEDGQESRDFVHVSDVSEAMALASSRTRRRLDDECRIGRTGQRGNHRAKPQGNSRNRARNGLGSISSGRYPP